MKSKKILLLGLLIPISMLFLSSQAQAVDIYEENDDFFNAVYISTFIPISADVIDTDDDWFYFHIDSGYTLNVTADFDGGIGDIDIVLFDSGANPLDSSTGTGDHEEITYAVTISGNFYVYVFNYDSTETSYILEVTYTTTTTGYGDEFEPNNDPSQAPLISLGEYYESNGHELNCSDDDFYNVTVTAGNTLMVIINFTSSLGDLELELYNSTFDMVDISYGPMNKEMCYWTAPTTQVCTIYVQNTDSGSNDYGMNITIIPGSIPSRDITVTNPTSTSIWQRTREYEITWTSTGLIGNLAILCVNFTTMDTTVITMNTANDGSFLWTVPAAIPLMNYVLYFQELEYGFIGSSYEFKIAAYAELSINVTAPTFATIWNNGSSHSITWTSVGLISNVDIDLFNSTDDWLETVADNTANDGSFLWLVGNYPTATGYYIAISDSSNIATYDLSEDFIINNSKSGIELILVTSPVDSPTWYKGNTEDITWIGLGSFSNVDIELWNSTNLVLTIATNTPNDGSYSWTIPSSFPNLDEYHIEIHDSADSIPLGESDDLTICYPTWTFLVYLDGDNNLEASAITDFLEMASVGSDMNIQIVVQFDRISGESSSYGDWTSTKRYFVTNGMTPTAANALVDLGELNMANPTTLLNFINWGVSNYPADNIALVLWNHGGGWKSPNKNNDDVIKSVCWDDSSGTDCLTQIELKNVLEAAGVHFDLIGFDACLMAMAEVDYQIQDYADVRVGSEETEPGAGWAWDTFLANLTLNPTMDAHELGEVIVDKYMDSYAPATTETQSAVDLTKMSTLSTAIDNFALELTGQLATYLTEITDARDNCSYSEDRNYYVDLYNFTSEIYDRITDAAIRTDAQSVMDAIEDMVLEEGHGTDHLGFHGITIYFPSTPGDYDNNYETYLNFTEDLSWDEFLTSYLDTSFPDDKYEINDDYTTAFDFTENKSVWLNLIDGYGIQYDNDWYKINATKGDKIYVDCTFTDSLGDIDIELCDSNGNSLAKGESSDDNESIVYTATTTGTYYLRVYTYNDEFAGNEYNLKWNTVPGESGDDDDDDGGKKKEKAVAIPGYSPLILVGFTLITIVGLISHYSRRKK